MYSSIARRTLFGLVRCATFVASLGAAHAQEQASPVLQQAQPQVQPQAQAQLPGITRIRLTADELPVQARPQLAYAAQVRAPQRQMERDAITLRAAHAAMLQNEASHQQQRLALLR